MSSYRSHTQACSSHLFNCDWIKQAAKASHDLWNYKLWTINVYLSQHVLNALFSCWRIFHQLNFEPTWLVVNCSRFLLNDQEITAVSWFYGLWKYQFTCAHCRSPLGTAQCLCVFCLLHRLAGKQTFFSKQINSEMYLSKRHLPEVNMSEQEWVSKYDNCNSFNLACLHKIYQYKPK